MTAEVSRAYLEQFEGTSSALELRAYNGIDSKSIVEKSTLSTLKRGIRNYRDWKAVVDAGGEKLYQAESDNRPLQPTVKSKHLGKHVTVFSY